MRPHAAAEPVTDLDQHGLFGPVLQCGRGSLARKAHIVRASRISGCAAPAYRDRANARRRPPRDRVSQQAGGPPGHLPRPTTRPDKPPQRRPVARAEPARVVRSRCAATKRSARLVCGAESAGWTAGVDRAKTASGSRGAAGGSTPSAARPTGAMSRGKGRTHPEAAPRWGDALNQPRRLVPGSKQAAIAQKNEASGPVCRTIRRRWQSGNRRAFASIQPRGGLPQIRKRRAAKRVGLSPCQWS